MLTLKYLSENTRECIERLAVKHFDAEALIGEILELDLQRRNAQTRSDACAEELNALSRSIGQLMKEGKKQEAAGAREKTLQLKEESNTLEIARKEAEIRIQELLVQIPNLPHRSVPAGKGAEDNVT